MFLDDRRKALEDKFFHNQEENFLNNARHIKEVGIWAAEKLGLDDAAEVEYVKQIISLAMDDKTGASTIKKIENDFHAAALILTEDDKTEILNDLKMK